MWRGGAGLLPRSTGYSRGAASDTRVGDICGGMKGSVLPIILFVNILSNILVSLFISNIKGGKTAARTGSRRDPGGEEQGQPGTASGLGRSAAAAAAQEKEGTLVIKNTACVECVALRGRVPLGQVLLPCPSTRLLGQAFQ